MAKIGVVLSSGGGRGVFAHTGFMTALSELGVSVEAASGCSAGAIVGGILASGTDVRDWTRSLLQVRTQQYWTPRSLWRLVQAFGLHRGLGIRGLSATDAAIDFLTENTRVGTFEECIHPFSVVAVDLETVEKVTFAKGPLARCMMASAAMPGFYDPVEIGGHCYSDGAVLDLAPAEAICCRYQLDSLIVHHVSQQDFTAEGFERTLDQPWPIVGLMHRLIFRQRPWYATGRPRSIHRCPCGCKALILVVEPKLPDLAFPPTAGGTDVLRAAHAHTMTQLEPILTALRSAPHTLFADERRA